MIETNLIRCVINDILLTEEYTLPGIAHYTDTPEEVIFELASGLNSSPTLLVSRKIIELHRTIRPQLYAGIVHKVTHNNSVNC